MKNKFLLVIVFIFIISSFVLSQEGNIPQYYIFQTPNGYYFYYYYYPNTNYNYPPYPTPSPQYPYWNIPDYNLQYQYPQQQYNSYYSPYSTAENFDGIIISGDKKFVNIIKPGLSLLKQYTPFRYQFVKEHTRKIELCQNCVPAGIYAFSRIAGNWLGDYTIYFNTLDFPIPNQQELDRFIASTILHEAVHLAGGGEVQAYTQQIYTLQELRASQQLINFVYNIFVMVQNANSNWQFHW